MRDLELHTHLTVGVVDGCPACALVTADLTAGRARLLELQPA